VSAVAVGQSDQVIVAAVRAAFGEIPVLLCGSRAAGTSTPASDYDLLVAMPRRHIPLARGRLGALATALSEELDAPVSVNPLPPDLLRRRRNLFVWKLRREARVLLPEHGFVLSAPGAPPLDEHARFSYLMTALLNLLSVADSDGGDRRERAVRKALLHVAQLRLWSEGAYPVTLEEALEELDDERIAAPASRAQGFRAWCEARSLVVAELAALQPRRDGLRAVRTNIRYAVLAALHGRLRLRAAASLRAIDRRLADVAVELAMAAGGPPTSRWLAKRDLVLAEWPDAHPLVAQ
jgi:predicted nucleotidyltransferase